jgi:hypothetical protein
MFFLHEFDDDAALRILSSVTAAFPRARILLTELLDRPSDQVRRRGRVSAGLDFCTASRRGLCNVSFDRVSPRVMEVSTGFRLDHTEGERSRKWPIFTNRDSVKPHNSPDFPKVHRILCTVT